MCLLQESFPESGRRKGREGRRYSADLGQTVSRTHGVTSPAAGSARGVSALPARVAITEGALGHALIGRRTHGRLPEEGRSRVSCTRGRGDV